MRESVGVTKESTAVRVDIDGQIHSLIFENHDAFVNFFKGLRGLGIEVTVAEDGSKVILEPWT